MDAQKYEIRIAGTVPAQVMDELGDGWSAPGGIETVLRGSVPDQAALIGIINWLQSLGIELREVRQIEDAATARDGRSPGRSRPGDAL